MTRCVGFLPTLRPLSLYDVNTKVAYTNATAIESNQDNVNYAREHNHLCDAQECEERDIVFGRNSN